ncbi:MAG: AAA family ATPase [Nocardioides sp.]
MDCTSCGARLPDGAVFCHVCGTRHSPSACAQCHTELLPGAVFCSSCGTPVAGAGTPPAVPPTAEAERRVTSILFGDLVSYTTLSENRDTEDVRDLLSAYFDTCNTVIKRYGGTVEKFIGDAVMAVWGVPVAHEDDAERAVRAGLELVAQVGALGERLGIDALALRVGIVTGEVTATLTATDQGMVAGDPVNTAARIQAAAGPGEVFVDAATRSLTAAAVTYADAGEHELKGKAGPIQLHRAGSVVAGVGGLQRMDGLEAPLVGRDRELRLLKELFHATEESGRPHLVVLDGEGGIGKSRIAWELEKYADGLSTSIRWHRGRCLSYGDGVAFWALAEAVRGRVGVVGDEPASVVLAGLERLLDAQVPDEAERGWLRPRVASLLGEESRDFAREDLFAAWTRFFERVAEGGPLVLVVDDAHHLDDGMAEFLDFLVGRGAFACFVVVLARPELLEARPHLGGRRATALRLQPLADAAMAQLVDGLVDGLLPEIRDALVERSGGIPLYAVETVRALIDRDLVVPSGGRYVAADRDLDLTTLGPPASLHALVAARLDALDPVERRVLGDASVLGEAFTREGVVILAADVPHLDRVLDSLVHKQLLGIEVDRFSAERGQYRFVQTVVRQVAYGILSRRDRRSRHLMVADHLSAETERADELAQVIAQHLLDAVECSAADDTDVVELRSRAGDLLSQAAERAYSLGAYADAVRAFNVALGCRPEPVFRALVLRQQCKALQRLNRPEEALPLIEESVALLDGAGEQVEAAESDAERFGILHALERMEEGMEQASRRLVALTGLAGHDRAAVDRVRAMLLSHLAGGHVFTGRRQEAEGPLLEALRISNRIEDPTTFIWSSTVLAIYQSRYGSQRIARTLLKGIVDYAREAEQWLELSVALANLGVHVATLDLDEAIRLSEESFTTAVEHGLVPDEVVYTNLLNYCWAAGRWDRVRELIVEVVESPTVIRLASFLAAAVVGQLRWAGAEVSTEAPMPDREYAGVYSGTQEFAAGSVALGEGDLTTATEQLWACVSQEAELVGLFDDIHVMWPIASWAALASEASAPEALRTLVARVIAEAPPSSALLAHARVFRALLAVEDGGGEEPVDVEADLREGGVLLERCGVRVWAAHAHEALGRWLLAQGRDEEAGVPLASAAETYRSLGATRWLERLQGLPAGTGSATRHLQ